MRGASESDSILTVSNSEQILMASDAARILGLSRDMVRILARQGHLASARAANGIYLFRRRDVEELARAREEERRRAVRG